MKTQTETNTKELRSYELILGDSTSREVSAATAEEAAAKAKQVKDAVRLKDRYDGKTVWEAGK